jgi:adenylate cyclase
LAKIELRLRPTLVATIVGLVLLTAAAIGSSAAFLTLRDTRELINRSREADVKAAVAEIHTLFELGPQISSELAAEAERGVLPLDDPHSLAARFAERLRTEPDLAWIAYASKSTGQYIGATRWTYGSDEVVEYIADPKVNGGIPEQFAVARNGERSKPSQEKRSPYLVVEKEWFKKAITSPGPVFWLPPYEFTEGGLGITAGTLITRPGESQPSLLFEVDLRLNAIANFLSDLEVGTNGAVFLVSREGRRIASPIGEHVAAAGAAVDAAAAGHFRPPIATPLRIETNGRVYQVIFTPVPVTGNLGLLLAVALDLADITEGANRAALNAGLIGLAAALTAILFGVLLSSRIAQPVAAIAADLAEVGDFRISATPAPQSFIREIGALGQSVDRMKASLRSFGHYVPTDLVRSLLAAGREATLGGEVRRLTIHFSDVANFTSIAERLEPKALVEATGRYFEVMTMAITRHGGTVDKFMGDGLLAFYNAPTDLAEHPRLACVSALEAEEALADLEAKAGATGQPVFRARIGLAVGDVLVGNIGTPERFAYTVIGDAVNLASRLEGLNKVYGTRILAGDFVVEEAGDGFEWRRIDRVAVKGRTQGTPISELMGLKGQVAPDRLRARDHYEAALDRYFAGDFLEAERHFGEALAAWPEDHAATLMQERSRSLAAAPPPSWDGIHVMHEK